MAYAKTGYLIAPVAGLLAPFALAPYDLWLLAPLSLILLLHSLDSASPRQGLFIGWLYGLGLYGSGVFWVFHSIHDFGNASTTLAAGLTLLFITALSMLFTASFGYTFVRLFQQKSRGYLLGFPALWVIFEWLRSWLLTGFPWLLSGYAHTDTLLAEWAPVTGVYGVSFINALSASALYVLIRQCRKASAKQRTSLVALIIAPWLIAIPLHSISWTKTQGNAIKTSLIQPNISQTVKWQPEQRGKTLRQLYQQTEQHLDSDLIIWPENAVPVLYHQAQSYLHDLAQLGQQSNTRIISGLPYWQLNKDNTETFHNSITVLGETTLYHKQKLVPFGEYVPLQDWLRGLIEFFNLPMSDFRRGPTKQPPLTVDIANTTVKIAPYICYEIVYPDFVRGMAKRSDLLLTISDDSWFGTSAGPLQHLQMARMRAQENGKYLLRGTNNGVTAIIDPKGRVVARADSFVTTSLTSNVWATHGETLYTRLGSWPVLLICTLLILIACRQKPTCALINK